MIALAITGPTASGKTALSLELAEWLSGEIICCDSMQIYQGMDIGTAKATPEERARVPHHMLDFLLPTENYSAASYRESAMACARDITARGRLPIFVGGTGLYVDTLLRGEEASVPESDPEYREKILAEIKSDENITRLWERLRLVDPDSAEAIHKNNLKRVIRALEIYDKTGVPKSVSDRLCRERSSELRMGMITLDFHSRELLYSRVDSRVDAMMEEGLLDEVRRLYSSGALTGNTTATAAIGYKELVAHLVGERSLADAVEDIKLATRRYAKRQLTWFRHSTDAKRLFVDTEDGVIKDAGRLVSEARDMAAELLSALGGDVLRCE